MSAGQLWPHQLAHCGRDLSTVCQVTAWLPSATVTADFTRFESGVLLHEAHLGGMSLLVTVITAMIKTHSSECQVFGAQVLPRQAGLFW